MIAIDILRRFRLPLLWLGAISCGVLAFVLGRSYLDEQIDRERRRLQPDRDMVQVIVAKRDLTAGTVLSSDTAALRRIPASLLPEGAVAAGQFDQVAGRRLRAALRSGTPVFAALLEDARPPGLSTRIRQGIRAMTIAVDEVNAVSGMLRPGDRIDLVFSVREPLQSSTLPETARLLMQNLLVLATGQRLVDGELDRPGAAGRFASITVEVTPEQAKRLILAQRTGRITALLRHPDDRALQAGAPMDLIGLLGLQRGAARPARTLELIVGGRGPLRGETTVRSPSGRAAIDQEPAGRAAGAAHRPAPAAAGTTAGGPER